MHEFQGACEHLNGDSQASRTQLCSSSEKCGQAVRPRMINVKGMNSITKEIMERDKREGRPWAEA